MADRDGLFITRTVGQTWAEAIRQTALASSRARAQLLGQLTGWAASGTGYLPDLDLTASDIAELIRELSALGDDDESASSAQPDDPSGAVRSSQHAVSFHVGQADYQAPPGSVVLGWEASVRSSPAGGRCDVLGAILTPDRSLTVYLDLVAAGDAGIPGDPLAPPTEAGPEDPHFWVSIDDAGPLADESGWAELQRFVEAPRGPGQPATGAGRPATRAGSSSSAAADPALLPASAETATRVVTFVHALGGPGLLIVSAVPAQAREVVLEVAWPRAGLDRTDVMFVLDAG